jgi:hypothetical protein
VVPVSVPTLSATRKKVWLPELAAVKMARERVVAALLSCEGASHRPVRM